MLAKVEWNFKRFLKDLKKEKIAEESAKSCSLKKQECDFVKKKNRNLSNFKV